MTNQHPITPPTELIQQWWDDIHGASYEFDAVLTQAARWGADQELEACREEIIDGAGRLYIDDSKPRVCLADDIWTARRPKPPSLKEQALSALYAITSGADDTREFYQDIETVKKALKSLPE